MEAVELKHIPFGRPKMLQVNQSYCVLHQEAFVSGYSQQARMALWTSFTMDTLVGGPPKGGKPEHTGSCGKPTGSWFLEHSMSGTSWNWFPGLLVPLSTSPLVPLVP